MEQLSKSVASFVLSRIKGTMTKKKEEWQDPDSGYLNCIGVGDTYVKKQIARILSQNKLTADYVSLIPLNNGIEIYTDHVEFNKKEL